MLQITRASVSIYLKNWYSNCAPWKKALCIDILETNAGRILTLRSQLGRRSSRINRPLGYKRRRICKSFAGRCVRKKKESLRDSRVNSKFSRRGWRVYFLEKSSKRHGVSILVVSHSQSFIAFRFFRSIFPFGIQIWYVREALFFFFQTKVYMLMRDKECIANKYNVSYPERLPILYIIYVPTIRNTF